MTTKQIIKKTMHGLLSNTYKMEFSLLLSVF